MKYILIVYKPESYWTCMCCVEEHYHPYFEVFELDDEKELISKAAEFKSKNPFLGRQEKGYKILIVKGELLIDELEFNIGLESKLYSKIEHVSNLLIKEKTLEREAKIKAEEDKKAKREEKEEQIEYERLKRKFEREAEMEELNK